eukprot:158107_1
MKRLKEKRKSNDNFITDEQWEFEEKERLKIIKEIDSITGQNDPVSRVRFFIQQVCTLLPAQIPNMSHTDTKTIKHKKRSHTPIHFDEQSLKLLEKTFFEYPIILNYDSCAHFDSKIMKQFNTIDEGLITKLFLINNRYAKVPSIREYQLINQIPPGCLEMSEYWESDYHRNWSDIHSNIKSFCLNCWLFLLPYLHNILKKIVEHSEKYHRKCLGLNDKSTLTNIVFTFLNDDTTLYHFHFISELLNFSIILKIVFSKKKLYKYLFRYYWIMCKMVLCTDMIHRQYNQIAILSEIKMKLLDQFFLKTFVFWNSKKHEKYLRQLGGLVMNFVIKNITAEDYGQCAMQGPSTISSLLFCLKTKCNISKNDSLWNSSNISKFIRDFCWLQYNGWI